MVVVECFVAVAEVVDAIVVASAVVTEDVAVDEAGTICVTALPEVPEDALVDVWHRRLFTCMLHPVFCVGTG